MDLGARLDRGVNMQIGVIADTHSKMRPEALEALEGSDLILHAGDVGRDEVLEALEAIAPLVAIRWQYRYGRPCSDAP